MSRTRVRRILSMLLVTALFVMSGSSLASAIQAGNVAPEAGFGKAYNTTASGLSIPGFPAHPRLQWWGPTNITIEAWVKPTASGGGVIYWVPGYLGLQETGFHLLADNRIQAGLSYQSGAWEWLQSPDPIPADTWTHVAMTKSANILTIYVNGAQVAQRSVWWVMQTSQPNYREHYVFSSWDGDNLDAVVDELRVFDTAVSQTNLDAWRFRGADPSHPNWANLVNYWAFEEGSGTQLSVRSGVSGTLPITGWPAAAPLDYSWTPSTIGLEYKTNEETEVTGRLPMYDADGDALTTAVAIQAAHGTAVITDAAAGTFKYTPAPNFFGTDIFKYTVSDGIGPSAPAVVTINVAGTPDAPTASDVSYQVKEGSSLKVSAPGVLSGAADVDGDALHAALVAAPASGTLALNADGSFTYTPAAGFFGTDTFTFKAGDGSAYSGVANATIVVTPKSKTERILEMAHSLIGSKYRWGGKGPTKFDSSGFVRYVYASQGVNLPRTAKLQYRYGPKLAYKDAQPGDLIFFYKGVRHVGIYLGDGMMIDCNKPGGGVKIRPVYYRYVTGVTRPLAK